MQKMLLAFIFGVITCQTLPVLPPQPAVYLLLCLLVLLGLRLYPFKIKKPSISLQVFFIFGIGLFWAAWIGESRLSQQLIPVLEKKQVTATGYIVGLPKFYAVQVDDSKISSTQVCQI
ncbi:DUF4131 domain-containing protein [Candidatus Venteria ishoeyi]|uniref:Competence protein n=1 Tax=Candidatus Venteria ishoeyi TaxID=1899563 RepID=A0A1H6FFP3_9GAMM|nr:DUF4131 domain-containing protein [Candidatus Venteria ishoeyi]SEH08847.1 Uncharacterised protein [Candidatus Venteria ishoeyi]